MWLGKKFGKSACRAVGPTECSKLTAKMKTSGHNWPRDVLVRHTEQYEKIGPRGFWDNPALEHSFMFWVSVFRRWTKISGGLGRWFFFRKFKFSTTTFFERFVFAKLNRRRLRNSNFQIFNRIFYIFMAWSNFHLTDLVQRSRFLTVTLVRTFGRYFCSFWLQFWVIFVSFSNL